MKNQLQLFFVLLLISVSFIQKGSAQCPNLQFVDLRGTPGFPQTDLVNVCGDPDTLSILIFTDDPGDISGFEMTMNFVSGMRYAGFEETHFGGGTTLSNTDPDISSPSFLAGGITSGDIFVANVGVTGDCSVDLSNNDYFIEIEYAFFFTDPSGAVFQCKGTEMIENDFNSAMKVPVVNMLTPSPIDVTVSSLGAPTCQTVILSQDGLQSYLNEVNFSICGIDTGTGSPISLSSMTANGLDVLSTATYSPGDTSWTTLLDATVFASNTSVNANGTPEQFDTGEKVTLRICYEVANCPESGSDVPFTYKADYGCFDEVCQLTGQASFLKVRPSGSALPTISASLGNGITICGDDATVVATIQNGNVADTDQFVYTDVSIGFQGCGLDVIQVTEVTINGITVPPVWTVSGDDIDIDLSNNTDSSTGLVDYDGDGFYDDMAGGSGTLDVVIKFNLGCGVGGPYGGTNCPTISCENVQFYLAGATNCGNSFRGFPPTDGFALQYGQTEVSNPNEAALNNSGSVVGYDFGKFSNMGAPLAATNESIQEIEFCFDFGIENIEECPSGPDTRYEAVIAGASHFITNVAFVPGTAMFSNDGGATYAAVANGQVSISTNAPDDTEATFVINEGTTDTQLCYKYQLQFDLCLCSPASFLAVTQQVVSTCSDCTPDCDIVKACRNTLFRVDPECSPCPCVAQFNETKLERANLGYLDKQMTMIATPADVPAEDLRRFMPGDTLDYEGSLEILSQDILDDPIWWSFQWYCYPLSGSFTTSDKMPLSMDAQNSLLESIDIVNLDGTTHNVDITSLAGCMEGGIQASYNSYTSNFSDSPWLDYVGDARVCGRTFYNSQDGFDNNYLNIGFWNYDRMEAANAANPGVGARHTWGEGDCLNEFISTYGIDIGSQINFHWKAPLIKNPFREMSKIAGVAPAEDPAMRIFPVANFYKADDIAGAATYAHSLVGSACRFNEPFFGSCPGGLVGETDITIDNCGGQIEHTFAVSAFAGPPGDEWFTAEYRPLMEIHDLELPIYAPLAYCANAVLTQNGVSTPITVDSTENMKCSPVAGYSDDLCSVDGGASGSIIFDLHGQGFSGLGIGLDNCDTIKITYDYCMICPAPIEGLLDYQMLVDWCYTGHRPNECTIVSMLCTNSTAATAANSRCDELGLGNAVNYYNALMMDTLYCKEDQELGILFLDDSAVTPQDPVSGTNVDGIDLIAAASAGSSVETKEIEFCNPDPMDATGFSGYVTVPNPVQFVAACSDLAGTELTSTLVSDDGQVKKYQIDMPNTTLASGDCVSVFIKTTLLFCPTPGSLPPQICVGSSSGCSPEEVRAAIGNGGGACAASEVCYAYLFGEAGLQTEWFSMPATPPALCETFPLHVRTKNVKELLLLNVDPNFTLPFGLSIIPNSWEVAYPGGSVDMNGNFGAWTSVPDPDVVNGLNMEWSDESLWSSYIATNGLKGAFSTLDSNNIAFRFMVTTNCDEFLSGSKTRTETLASDPCAPGDLSSGIVESPDIIVEGADPADFAQILVVGSPGQLFCGGLDNSFGLTALNISDNPTTDSVVTCVTIPGDVLTYTPGSVNFANGFTPAWITETMIGSDMQVCFHSPALPPGELWSVSWEAEMISTAPCGDIEILADVKSVVEAVSCEPGPPEECDVFVQNSINPSIFVELSAPLETTDVRVSADCSTGNDPLQICYEIDLTNPGPDYNGNVNVAIHDDVTANGEIDSFDGVLNSGDHTVILASGESTTIMMCLDVDAIQSCPIVVRQTFETSCSCNTHDTPIDDLTPSWFAALPACVVLCPTQPLELETCGAFEITFDPAAGATMTDDGMGNVSISIVDGFGVDAPVIINYTGSLGECEVSDSRQLKSLGDFIPQDSTYVYCEGECIDLDLGIPDAVVDGAVITWTPSDYIFDPTAPVTEACAVPETTVYDVEIRFGDACVFNVQHTVEFNPSGSIGIGGDTEMCQGNPIATLTTDPGFDSYEWYRLAGGFEILTGNTIVPEWTGPIVAGAYIVKGYRSFDLCPSVSGVWNITYAECVDLELDKEICNIDPVPNIGDTITYCITVCNINDPSLYLTHDANDVTVSDSWPPALTYESYTATQGTFIFATPESTWSIPTIANGTCETIEIKAIINDYDTIENVAEITGSDKTDIDSEEDNDDGDQDEDDEDKETIVIPRMDLALEKTICSFQTFPVTIGDDVTYCIEVTNQGDIDAYNVGLVDYLPAEVTLNDPAWTDNMDGTVTNSIPVVLVGQTITVQLTTTLTTLPTGPVTNTAEITGQEDADGDPVDDFDSTADSDPNNDGPVEDGTTDNSNGDEDDSDPATFISEVVDIALKKTTNNTGPVSIGQDITYFFTIYNQGNVAFGGVLFNDFHGAGLAFNAAASPAAWNVVSGTQERYAHMGLILPGDSLVVPIVLTVQPGANASNLRNESEIQRFFDEDRNDITDEDIDSDGDDDPSNDGTMDDNSVDGENGDEDDSDFEDLPIFDLALAKVITTPGPYSYGQLVKFDITVYNQGNLDAWNIDVFDYLTCGYDFAPSNTTWTYTAATDVANTVSATTAPLVPGDSLIVSIELIVVQCAEAGAYTNTAEIAEATDEDGNPMPDLDSTPDGDPDNDGPMEDNATDGENGDEDDSDFALIEIFDLALAKTISTPGPYAIGQNIVFDIWVYNQGSETVQNVDVSDYVPAGYSYDPGLALNANWIGSGPTPATFVQTIPGPIVAGDSALVQIELTLENASSSSDWNNVGEISSFEDEDGMMQDDVDSTPDGDPSNDGPMEDNATDGENGDEDDSDFAFPEITDLALKKTIVTPGPYSIGQNIQFAVTVYNQGTTDAYNIEINDVLPCGFEFVGPTNWTHSVTTNTATTTVAQTTPLSPGDSIVVNMDVTMVSCSGNGAYRNSAEIAGSTDEDGNPQDDSDSTPDDDPTNDGPMEDDATDGENGDEDDSDFAEIQIFDLALKKTLITPGPYNFGDPLVFEIEVINQGTENVTNVSIAEYVPVGYSIDYTSAINNPWSGGATTPTTATATLPGPMIAGTSEFIQIELILEASEDPDAWKNVAEISGMEDEDGNPVDDVDSTPDDDPNNDGDMEDDATDGENGDEDDSDFAIPVVNDLALTKGITTPGPYAPGQVINYAIEVFNQGNQDAWNIEVVDYLPCGLLWIPNNPGWNYNPSNNTAVITAAQTTPLTPGNSLIVNIELEIFQCAEDDAFTNTSEIAGSTDEDGNPLPDTDSTPDDDPDNDGDMTDDATDGTNGDEDDSDFATFEIFDLALKKTASTPGPYSYGQTIVFDVTVYNQGTEPVQNVEVVDYIPGGFSYDDTDPINANWIGAGATPLDVTQLIPGPLAPGDSVILQVALVFEMGPADWKNVSEIASFEDEDGNPGMDIDSTPDSDPNNDGDMEDNATDGENGDEDDSDFELIEVFDLALKKTIVTPGPYSYGQTVTYAVTVYNQGNINAMNIGVADYLTCGFEYASNPAWTYDIANHVASQTVATTTPLVPGDSIVVNINLTMVQCAEPGAYTNTAEIFGATDEDGDPQEDIDSTADADPDNDGDAEDDATDGTNGDEDDADIAVIEIFDLALAKTISTPPPYSIGGSIVFDLVVYNQGSETVQNISVADYVPAGYDYDDTAALNANWIGAGPTPTTLTQTIAGPLAPGDSVVVQIELILNQAPADWQNTAEISGFEDEDGMMQDDVDSTPDADPNNDGPMEDDAVDGENGDEDDSDFALPEIFDLANKKVITTPGPYSYGQTVSFDIIVYNQGNQDAWNIDVVDYLPCGYEYATNAEWTYDAANHVASTTVAEITPLLPGDSIVINIDLTLIQCAEAGAYTNTSEIAGATDENGDPQEDIDSTADSDPDNEGPVSDNDTDGTGGDEDDSDIAVIEIFDLALAKTISTPPTYSYGQTLIFDLVVYNQGSETVQNITVADYVPAGYTYDAADPTNANWMGAGPTPTTLTQTIAGPLAAGDSTIVQIALILNQAPMDWANTAEISGFEDEDGMMQDDVDSTPDSDPNNDGPMEDNATDGENGDEDDSDFALPEIFDLALRKDLVTPGPYAYGMEVTFRIWVFNQGSMDANNIEITEYIPSGFEYDPALSVNTINGWSNFVTASPSTTINTTPALAPGDSTSVDVVLIIQESTEPGAHKNTSEISGAEDGEGNPQEDTDSTADNDPDNDGDMTDGETDNGNGDEDDSDFELVPIYDLALTKKLVTDPPYSVGQVLEFAIEVCNQAALTVTNIEVSDYVPVGYSYDPGLNAGWVGAGPTPTTVVFTMPGPIAGGECTTVPIFLTLQNAATSLDWQNVGEISNFQDEDGNDQDDVDSSPDDDPNNDGDMTDDATDGENGDEDDSDFAGPDMLSEPMIANVKSTTNTNLLADGNLDITFLIGVKNTGLFDLTDLSLIDDIASQIPSFNQMSVNVTPNVVMTSTTATSTPALDPAFDGSTNVDIFAGSTADLLEPGQEIWVEITIEIDPNTTTWPIDNQSEAGGTGLDDSGNEIGDVSDPSDSGSDFEGDNPGEPGDEGTSDDPTEVDCLPAEIIVTTNEAEICAGEDVTFAVSSDIPGVTYHWREVGTTTVISTSATPTFTDVMASMTYEVTLQVPAGLCVYNATEEFDIVVNQPPMVDLTASYTLNADCSPSDLSFTAVDGAGAGFASYDWSGPAGFTSSVANPILPTANSLNNGTYTVVVTDANGCTATESLQVLDVVSPVMQPVINSTGPACQGEEIVLNINQYSGAVVTYTWTTPAGITTDISGFGTNELVLSPVSDAQAGTYVLDIVVDGCQLQAEYVVEVEESPVVDANFVTVDACDGGSFEFTSNATGVNNLTYEWTGPNNWTSTLPNPNLNDVDVTFNGQYTVAVTSAAGCVTISDFVIDNILPPPAPASIDLAASEICDGETIELSSSAEGSMFEWISTSDSQGSLAQPGMTTTSGSTSFGPGHPEYQSGPWRVRVTDANGCVTESETINVEINPIPVAVANNAGPVCDGDQLELFASDINGAVYNWYDADPALGGVLVSTDQNPTITNLAQGSYTYFLQVDLDGCFSDVVPTTAQIAEPPQIVNDFIYSPNVDCAATDLALTSTTTMGTSTDLTYTWTGPNGFTSDEENPIIPTVGSDFNGSYVVMVTDEYGCTAISTIEVGVIPDAVAFTPVINSSGPACQGDEIILTTQIQTGTNVTYTWTTPNGMTNISGIGTNELILSQLTELDHEGTYEVMVNVDGCEVSSVAFVVEIGSAPTAVTDFMYTANIDCSSSDLNLSSAVTAGDTPIESYLWTGPNGFTSTVPNPILASAGSVNNGSYVLTVTDEFGCTGVSTVEISDIVDGLASTPIINSTGPACPGEEVVLTTAIQDGINVTYTWTTPNGTTNISGLNSNELIITPLTDADHEGMYTVTINVDGCEIESPVFFVDVFDPPAAAPMPSMAAVCDGNDLEIFANPNTDVTAFNWTGPNGFTSTAANPVINGVDLTYNGEYTLTLTGTNGCTSSTSVMINNILDEPEMPTIAAQSICDGEALVMTTSTAGQMFEWIGPNGQSQQTLSLTGLTTNTGNTALDPTSEAYVPGMWSVRVTDANGCVSTSAEVMIEINDVPVVIADNNSGVCAGDDVQLIGSEFTGANYFWYDADPAAGGVLVSTDQNPLLISPDAGTQNYFLVVERDGCQSEPAMTSVVVNEPPVVDPNFVYNLNLDCSLNGLNLESNVTGNGPFTYIWQGPNNFTSTDEDPEIPAVSEEANGSYTVSIVDANGCEAFAAVEVANIADPVAQPVIASSGPACDNGIITLTAQTYSGSNITYTWTTPAGIVTDISGVNTNEIIISPVDSTIHEGDYILTVNVDGCELTSTAYNLEIFGDPTAAQPMAVDMGVCEGDNILLESEFATSYSWTGPNGFTSDLQNPTIDGASLAAGGTYWLTVVNEQGCESDPTPIIIEVTNRPETPTIVANQSSICADQPIQLRTSTICDSYLWIGPGGSSQATLDHPKLTTTEGQSWLFPEMDAYRAGMWSVVCVNAFGCESEASNEIEIEINEIPVANPIASADQLCANEAFQLFAGNGYPEDAVFQWFDSDPTTGAASMVSNLEDPMFTEVASAGTHTFWLAVTVNGCESVAMPVSVEVSPEPMVIADNDGTECIEPTTDVNLDAVPAAGIAPFTYSWSGPNGFASIESNPILPNAIDEYSGTYIVTITDGNGCTAEAETVVDVTVVPEEPFLVYNGQVCEGEDITIVAPEYEGFDIVYEWVGPDGTTTTGAYTNGNIIVIEDASTLASGNYQVQVTVDGCTSVLSEDLPIEINEIPVVSTVNNADPCVGPDDDVTLTSTVTGGEGPYTYFWSGPNGFTSNSDNPLLPNVGTVNSGTYTMYVVDVNGCQSSAMSTEVFISEMPATPSLEMSTDIACEGEEIFLTTQAYDGDDVVYTWIMADGSSVQTTVPSLLIGTLDATIHNGLITVTVNVDGCDSQNAVSRPLEVNAIPTAPIVINSTTSTSPACEGEGIQLQTTFIPGATYQWFGPNGFTSDLPNPSILSSSMTDAGVYSLIVTLNGCSSEIVTSEVIVQETPPTPIVENDGPSCEDDEILLSIANPNAETLYDWFRTIDDVYVGTGASLTLPAGTSSAGSYYAIGSILECSSERSGNTEVQVDVASNEIAYAGIDRFICEDQWNLNASPVNNGVGHWTMVDQNNSSEIASPSSESTLVTELQLGANQFVWFINSGACGVTSSDTVTIWVNDTPTASNDDFEIAINEQVSDNVIINDQPNAADFMVTNITTTENGELVINDDGSFTYVPNENFVGTDVFMYEVCHVHCPENCVTATVSFKVGDEAECFAPTLITPNEDGWNDNFVVPCLANFPGSSICIFNRWGDQVFLDQNYQNNWNGTYQGNGETLPVGTYYYVIEVADGNDTKMSGYVFIQR